MLTWSYEANPACNVLVGENSEVTAAKSTVPETNKSSSSRPKTSTASTTSSSSATHQTNRAVHISEGGGSSSSISQPSSNSGGGGKNSIQQKRNRRSVAALRIENGDGRSDGDSSRNGNTVTATISSSSVFLTDKPLGTNDLSLHEISSAKSVTVDRYAAAKTLPNSPLHIVVNQSPILLSAASSSPPLQTPSIVSSSSVSSSISYAATTLPISAAFSDDGDVDNGLNKLHANTPKAAPSPSPPPQLLDSEVSDLIRQRVEHTPLARRTTESISGNTIDDNIDDGDSGLLSTNENLLNGFVNVFDVTHGTNSNQDLTATTNSNHKGNEKFDLITNSFDESRFDINNHEYNNSNDNDDDGDDDSNNNTSNGYKPSNNETNANETEMEDDMPQNDAPTIIANGQPSVEIVNLLDDGDHFHSPPKQPLSSTSSSSSSSVKTDVLLSSNDQIHIHTLPVHDMNSGTTKHKSIISRDGENDINKYPYIGASHPDRTYYQIHDTSNSNNIANENNNNGSINTHDQQHQMQRILVNISIATDSGAGTQNHGIYMLHVSVPAGPNFISPLINAPLVHINESSANTHDKLQTNNNGSTSNIDDSSTDSGDNERPPEIPPQPPCPCQCSDEFYSTAINTISSNEMSTIETLSSLDEHDEILSKATETSIISNNEAINDSPSSIADDISNEIDSNLNVTQSCLINQDIPTILILEGERMYLIMC